MGIRGFVSVLLIAAAVFIVISQSTVDVASGINSTAIDVRKGAAAPDFTLENVSGGDVTLSSFKGKAVLLNFWATWCPYCRKERSHLNSLYNDYKEKDLVILSVSTDRSANKVRDFLKDTPADFIVLVDSAGRVASTYNVAGLPTSFLINREGVIKYNFVGLREWSSPDARKLIDNLLDN